MKKNQDDLMGGSIARATKGVLREAAFSSWAFRTQMFLSLLVFSLASWMLGDLLKNYILGPYYSFSSFSWLNWVQLGFWAALWIGWVCWFLWTFSCLDKGNEYGGLRKPGD